MAQPLVEVFGLPVSNHTAAGVRTRARKLCPFQVAETVCTKVSVTDPLGVCSVADGASEAITCPTRFKEDWMIAEHGAGLISHCRKSGNRASGNRNCTKFVRKFRTTSI